MKNIHVLPTDKPSRLYLNTQEYIFENEYSLSTDECQNKHIYITSDEEIKEGDYILIHGHYKHGKHITKVVKITDTYEVIEGGNHSKKACQRIILTTDQDLIKDGVQAIDDEFLEWFVKNPSCEKVIIHTLVRKNHFGFDKDKIEYKIIIPKEEPRVLTVEAFNKAKISYKEPKQDEIMERFIANAKQQETLEEDLKFPLIIENGMDYLNLTTKIFNNGAKWQQERMFSEEDMKSFGDWCRNGLLNTEYGVEKLDEHLEQWKQFKK